MHTDYLKRILNAKVYDVAIESPLDHAPLLSARLQNNLLIKREDLQAVYSFKLRGAYNKMRKLSAEQLAKGVICASAGNHAQGVALAAAKLNCPAVIVMPVTTPQVKIDGVRNRGAQAVLHGESYTDAYNKAKIIQQERDLCFVHPFDDPDVIAGQGTIGMEILRQHGGPIHAVFVPIGGGGVIAGIAAYIKQLRPEVKIIGVQSVDSDAMKQSLAARKPIELERVGLFADGTAVKLVGNETLRLCLDFVDDVICVDTDALCAAIKDVFIETRAILEPSGALAIAGAKAYVERTGITGETLVTLASGANMNFDRLRFVAERAEIGEQREAVFAVTIPEERGSFRRFCQLVGNRSVTEFNYRIADDHIAHLFVAIQISERAEADQIADTFRQASFETLDLTDDELAKVHLRHLVGGHSRQAKHESVLRFEFPERPGALMQFLTSMSPNWNISLFHYRNHGADYGRVLVGIQVPPDEQSDLQGFLTQLGYRYWDETNNPAYQLFLAAGR